MKPRKMAMLAVDVSMTILCLMQMGYHMFKNITHEQLGAATFVLFLLHHFLNARWYKALPKGRYTAVRTFHTVLNLLLTAVMLGLIASAMIISVRVFDFLGFRTSFFGRKLHMFCTSWLFALMSMHIGLHWGKVVSMLQKRMKKPVVLSILAGLGSAWGVSAFIRRAKWQELFVTIDYVFFDYNESAVFFFCDYLAMIVMWGAIAFYLVKAIRWLEQRSNQL